MLEKDTVSKLKEDDTLQIRAVLSYSVGQSLEEVLSIVKFCKLAKCLPLPNAKPVKSPHTLFSRSTQLINQQSK